MKKILLTVTLFVSILGSAQTTIFEENWDGQGPGIAAWTLYNVDGLTPIGPAGVDGEALSFLVQDAWNVLSLADITGANADYTAHPANATGMANNIIASNSWYNPAGTANDWLVSPQILIPASATDATLRWAASSLGNSSFLEEYEVYVSTTGGSAVTDFTTLLLDVNNELSSGSYRSVPLPYAGQTIRLAFRNNSVDQYVMFLDNISITSASLSVDNFVSNKFSISPNPVKSMLSISNAENIKVDAILIVDVNGRIIKEVKYSNVSNINMDLSELSSGMYIMNINSDQGIATKKIVKE